MVYYEREMPYDEAIPNENDLCYVDCDDCYRGGH